MAKVHCVLLHLLLFAHLYMLLARSEGVSVLDGGAYAKKGGRRSLPYQESADLPAWDYQIPEPEGSVAPWEMDLMLMDVDSPLLHGSISRLLGRNYLSSTQNHSFTWPLQGIVHGKNSRLMVSAVTCLSPEKAAANEVDLKFISIHFLVDTGAPFSYLSEEAVKALSDKKFYYDTFDTIPVLVNGIPLEVHVSPLKSHFKDVCLLGADFLRAIQGELHAFYGGRKSFVIKKGSAAVMSLLEAASFS